MSSIAHENMRLLSALQSNWPEVLILKKQVAFLDDLFKMVSVQGFEPWAL